MGCSAIMTLPYIDWSQINTIFLAGIGAGVWRALMKVNRVDQAVIGIGGKGGLIDDVRELAKSKQELEKSVIALNAAVVELQKFRLTIESIVSMRKTK